MRYETAEAFRIALEQRLKNESGGRAVRLPRAKAAVWEISRASMKKDAV